jgi:hypothetical protein
MPKEYKDIISDISSYTSELRKLIPETMNGFGTMAKAATQTKILDEKTVEFHGTFCKYKLNWITVE